MDCLVLRTHGFFKALCRRTQLESLLDQLFKVPVSVTLMKPMKFYYFRIIDTLPGRDEHQLIEIHYNEILLWSECKPVRVIGVINEWSMRAEDNEDIDTVLFEHYIKDFYSSFSSSCSSS